MRQHVWHATIVCLATRVAITMALAWSATRPIDPSIFRARGSFRPLDAELIMQSLKSFARAGGAVVLTGHELPLILPHVDHVTWCAHGTTRDFHRTVDATNDFAFQQDFLGVH